MKKRNKKTRAEINRDYRKTHRNLSAVWKHKRRAKESEFGGFFSQAEWQEIKRVNSFKCVGCSKKKKLTVDHKIPLTRWGEWSKTHQPKYRWNDKENIQPMCGGCNSSKGNQVKIESELTTKALD